MKNKVKNILLIILGVVLGLTIGVSAATTIASASVTYGDTTVQAALDELIAVANQCPDNALCSKAKIGDYVRMTPTQTTYTIPSALTGYTSDQTINPSELNLWRVIDIKNDGTIEMVSEYVSSTKVYFKGQTGYLNFVGTLNNIANQYGNSNYTISARHMGYNGQTATITDTSKFTTPPPPWTVNTSDNSNETVGGGDVMYEYDTDTSTGLVYKALGTLVANNPSGTATAYWLGSRLYSYSSPTSYGWGGQNVNTSGTVGSSGLYGYSGVWRDYSFARALRPIATLKSDVQATGSGTSASPWVLS